MSRQLCVVFGGTGFLGRHLVAHLNTTYDVRVISRRPQTSASPHVSYRQVHLSQTDQLVDCVKDAHIVYHLATGTGTSWEDYERDFVRATRAIAEGCVEANVSRFVYVSSISALYLGAKRNVTEKDGTDPLPFRRNLYSRAKILAESTLHEFQHTHSLPVVIVRPGVVVGSGGLLAHGGLGHWPNDIHCLGWGRKSQPVPFVLVSDLTQALLQCGSQPGVSGQVFNLVGDFRPTAQEFLDRLANHTNRRFHFHRRSLSGIYAWSYLKFLLKRISGRPGLQPTLRDLRSRTFRSHLSNSLAKSQLGWSPVTDAEDFYREVCVDQAECSVYA